MGTYLTQETERKRENETTLNNQVLENTGNMPSSKCLHGKKENRGSDEQFLSSILAMKCNKTSSNLTSEQQRVTHKSYKDILTIRKIY